MKQGERGSGSDVITKVFRSRTELRLKNKKKHFRRI